MPSEPRADEVELPELVDPNALEQLFSSWCAALASRYGGTWRLLIEPHEVINAWFVSISILNDDGATVGHRSLLAPPVQNPDNPPLVDRVKGGWATTEQTTIDAFIRSCMVMARSAA